MQFCKMFSFLNENFPATVTRISDKAEFTPQNVQTKEGRQTTVYAIELSVDNKDGKLKPGMPTDVTFASRVTAEATPVLFTNLVNTGNIFFCRLCSFDKNPNINQCAT